MAYSMDFSDAQAFQAYVEEHSSSLYSRLFLGFLTSQHVVAHEGVKGRKTLNELALADLFRRYAVDFSAVSNAMSITPKTIETTQAKIDLTLAPVEFEGNYLGFLRQTGQNPRDFPFQAYILDKVMKKATEEVEISYWKGEAAGAPAASDTLVQLYDGILHRIADAITATDLTPYSSGVLTDANILGHVEAMFDLVGDHWKSGTIKLFLSHSNYSKLLRNYRNDIGKYTSQQMTNNVFRLPEFGNLEVVPTMGMQNSNRLVMTVAGNLQYAYDGPGDMSMMNFEWNKRKLDMWMDIRIGAQALYLDDASAAIIVNDQV